MPSTGLDFQAFAANANRTSAQSVNPTSLARAGHALVNGALRIRHGGNGLYGTSDKSVITKPAEAVGAWIKSMQAEIVGGNFHRTAELREAIVAAAEEVDAATLATPKATRLREALYTDALHVLGGSDTTSKSNLILGIAASILGGLLLGLLLPVRK